MPKSKAERERLELNAKMQHVLTQHHVRNGHIQQVSVKPQNTDISQPSGEIDYSKFNKSASKAKK
jgi:hypothetical protein